MKVSAGHRFGGRSRIARGIAVLGCTWACVAAAAEDAGPRVWINPGVYSYHFNRDKGYRDDNIGFGAELQLNDDHGVLAGSFVNSDRARTHYAAYQWRPLHWRLSGVNVGAGVIVGAFDGYPRYHDGGWFVTPLPVVAFEGRRLGLNMSVIPNLPNRVSGALSFQLKLRVW